MKKTICGLFVSFLLVLTPPLFARKTCQSDADCDDKDHCTSDACSNETCFYFITCIGAEVPPPPQKETPVNKAALEECKKTCLDEPCWDASCTNDGKCFKLATCISASVPPPPGIVVPAVPVRTVVPKTPPPPIGQIPPAHLPPPGIIPSAPVPPVGKIPSSPLPPISIPQPPPPPPPPAVDDKTPEVEDVEKPLRRCDELSADMRACCLRYDDPANGGNGDGRPNGKEMARLVKDEACRPRPASGSGPTPSVADECSGLFKVFAGEGSSVTVTGFNQCCQALRNTGDVVDLTMRQNCENHMGLAPAGSAGGGGGAGDGSTPAGSPITGKSLTDESKVDEGGCQLIRPE